jgi:multiple sugar transport system substrate-binding protein
MSSSKSEKKITEIYFADRITAAHQILIDQYNRENEGKVKVVPIDFPNYDFNSNERKELLARSLKGRGDGIDLFAVDLIWVQRFAKWCEPLDKYFPRNERVKLLEKALESCFYEGELVALPLNRVQGVMYYREDLINNLPNGNKIISKLENKITWEEFIKIGREIKQTYPFYIYAGADFEGLICSFVELLLSLEPNYFDKHGFDFNTSEAEESLKLLVDLVHKYNLSPKVVTELTDIPSYEYFIENDGLFLRGWISYDKDFVDSPFNVEKENNLKKASIPHFSGGKKTSVFGGWNLMMSKFSDKKDEVVDFIKFLLSESSQELFYRESGYYPIIKRFYENGKYKNMYPEIDELIELHKSGVHRSAHSEYTRYSEIMSRYIEHAIKNELGVKEALQQITHDIRNDKIIKQF